MVIEIAGFISGVAAVGGGLLLLLNHERERVLEGIRSGRARSARRGIALIWPSR